MIKKLQKIQAELKVPKSQKNTFGGFNYRSCEDILEAVKPICHDHDCVLSLSDEVVAVGDRVYVKATATLFDDDANQISTTAFAREPENKKGMDDSQQTGTASSYARKYALNGLFCIDDTKDADTDAHTKARQEATQKQYQKAVDLVESTSTYDELMDVVKNQGVQNDISELKQYDVSLAKKLKNHVITKKEALSDANDK